MLVPLRIKIGYDGKCKYPPFDEIPAEKRKFLSWQKYFDFWGGWQYDKLSGFGESDDYNSDPDFWFGAVLVGADFAEEAVTRWPDLCEILDEVEFAHFYDNRTHIGAPESNYNAEVLNGIRAKYDIVGPFPPEVVAIMDKEDQDALDPDHPSPGICKNRKKNFARLKENRRLQINTPEIARLKALRG